MTALLTEHSADSVAFGGNTATTVSQVGSDVTLWARCPYVSVTVKPLSLSCLSAACPAISCAGERLSGEGRWRGESTEC